MRKALTIAGSDSGGGAGIQADLKTFSALGVYGASVVTALTAQNTLGVQGILEIPPSFVAWQIDSVLSDIGADAVKTGMLANAEIVSVVAERLQHYHVAKLVVDPVMVAKSGAPLLHASARQALIEKLLPLAMVVTPNRYEAEALCGLPITDLETMRQAAQALHALGPRYVVVKGGHVEGEPSVDILYNGESFTDYSAPRIPTQHTHGIGCTFASAIAAGLAKGQPVPDAVSAAKEYLTEALRHAIEIGAGHGPPHHFACWWED